MKNTTKLAALALLLVAAFFAGRRAGFWASPKEATKPAPTARPTAIKIAKPTTKAPPARIAALMRVETRDDPKGALRLEGQVIDADEKPVAGAKVAIDANPSRTATSESDGSFAFDNLPRRGYSLEAHAGTAYAGKVYLRLAPDTEPVILRMRPSRSVRVQVSDDATGKPVAGAEVSVRSTLTWTAQTDAKGVATLDGIGADDMTLHVRASRYAPVDRRLVAGDDKVQRERVALLSGAPVDGVVVDEGGKPVAGARVVPTRASEPFTFVDRRRDGVVTDRRGRWRIPVVAAGTYRFSASHDGHAPAATAPVLVDGIHPREGVAIVLPAGATITGVVTTAAGPPAAGADVRFVARGTVRWRTALRTHTDDQGRFELRDVPRRAGDLVASHRTGSSELVAADMRAETKREVTLSLSISGFIAGVVVDEAGETIAEAQVFAEPEPTGAVGVHQAWAVRGAPLAIADAGGKFHFTGLPAGTYRVRAARPGASEAAVWLAPGTVVPAGTGDLRIVLRAPGGIKGRVLLADGTAPAAFTIAIGATTPVPFASEDGVFYMSAPGGTHNAFVTGPGFTRKIVEAKVTGTGTTDLGTITVEPGRSVSGRVLDENGAPVAKATVAAGALLTGDGAKLYVPDESIAARNTETDEDGRFALTGFDKGAITVVAGRDRVGRSRSVRIPPGTGSTEIDLVLTAVGSLSGKVTRDGKPVAETVVIANPVGATSSNFFVLTGADGSFALDALAPGAYVVYPMIGGGGGKPKDMFVRPVTVTAGARAEVDVTIKSGTAGLDVSVVTDAGAPVGAAQVFVVGAEVDAPNMDMLRDGSWITQHTRGTAPVPFYLRNAFGGPAGVDSLIPGRYTACVVPFPVDPRDPVAAQRLRSQVAQLPMKCAKTTVAAGTARTKLVVTVPAAWATPKE